MPQRLFPFHVAAPAVLAALPCVAALAQTASPLERVTISAGRPTTLPLEIPASAEGLHGAQVERALNATDASDALKYLPSLVVRKRHAADHDHAVLASRASGTGNSARSLVYADGILLSNLLGNGAEFAPRWGLVSADEIERVDVLYGPFSAAYPGNSAGAIVDILTRLPTRLEGHVKLQLMSQRFRLDALDRRYGAAQAGAALGDRAGPLAWWLHLNRYVGDGQPLVVVRAAMPGAGAGGTPVTGAVPQRDPFGRPVLDLGTAAQTHSAQQQAKLKLALDLGERLRASLTIAGWTHDTVRRAESSLRDADGRPVHAGRVSIDGRALELAPNTFAPSRGDGEHRALALGLKTVDGGDWGWSLQASRYAMRRDTVRTPGAAVAAPASFDGGPGRLVDLAGTGWHTLAARGLWRGTPQHVVEFGLQHDAWRLNRREADAADWIAAPAGTATAVFAGRTALDSLWLQDAWSFAPAWRAVYGLRAERWQAVDGLRSAKGPAGLVTVRYPARRAVHLSPKAALAWSASETLTWKAALGRAVRMPTVSELFQGGVDTTTGLPTLNDPALRPEDSLTAEFGLEQARGEALRRATLFAERTRDALYAQAASGGTTVQNVGRIRTRGAEFAARWNRLGPAGLALAASVTYADSIVTRNDALPASVGRHQPRVPRWRAHLLASLEPTERSSASIGLRYSSAMHGQLDNSDTNGRSYQGFSRYLVADVRLQARLAAGWRATLGIDNLGNARYWAFHPYPQRTLHAELRHDL